MAAKKSFMGEREPEAHENKKGAKKEMPKKEMKKDMPKKKKQSTGGVNPPPCKADLHVLAFGV